MVKSLSKSCPRGVNPLPRTIRQDRHGFGGVARGGRDRMSDLAVLRAESGVFGPVASDPTVSRLILFWRLIRRKRCPPSLPHAQRHARAWPVAAGARPRPRDRCRASGDHRSRCRPDRRALGEGTDRPDVQARLRFPLVNGRSSIMVRPGPASRSRRCCGRAMPTAATPRSTTSRCCTKPCGSCPGIRRGESAGKCWCAPIPVPGTRPVPANRRRHRWLSPRTATGVFGSDSSALGCRRIAISFSSCRIRFLAALGSDSSSRVRLGTWPASINSCFREAYSSDH